MSATARRAAWCGLALWLAAPDRVIAAAGEHGLPQHAVEVAQVFGFPITNSMIVTWIAGAVAGARTSGGQHHGRLNGALWQLAPVAAAILVVRLTSDDLRRTTDHSWWIELPGLVVHAVPQMLTVEATLEALDQADAERSLDRTNLLLTHPRIPQVEPRYADINDVTRIDDMFCEGLAARIARDVCETLTNSTAKHAMIDATYRDVIARARLANAIEVGSEESPEDDFITCRN